MEKDTQVALGGLAAAKLDRRRRQKSEAGGSEKKGNFMGAIFRIFPLLVVPVALYCLLSAMGGSAEVVNPDGSMVAVLVSPLQELLNTTFMELPMISGVKWQLTNGDAILLLAIIFLFLEILKSTSTGTSTIINHAVSMMLFILCLVLFLLNADFATSTFFILMSMTLLDVLAGVVVTIVSARRDFGMSAEG